MRGLIGRYAGTKGIRSNAASERRVRLITKKKGEEKKKEATFERPTIDKWLGLILTTADGGGALSGGGPLNEKKSLTFVTGKR